jgi:hypothetical protein
VNAGDAGPGSALELLYATPRTVQPYVAVCPINTHLQLDSAPSVAPVVIAVRVSDVGCCDAPAQESGRDVLTQTVAPYTDSGLPRLHREWAHHTAGQLLPKQV